MMLAVGEHVLGELDPRMAKMPTPFAGGVGDTREEMCGALSGGLMVIGALCGRTGPDENDDTAMRLATRYRELFAEKMGDTHCGPVYERHHAPDGTGSCAVVAEQAAEILLALLS
jgi:C_GCAxxG_C_C family probable redox protein